MKVNKIKHRVAEGLTYFPPDLSLFPPCSSINIMITPAPLSSFVVQESYTVSKTVCITVYFFLTFMKFGFPLTRIDDVKSQLH